MPPIIPEVLGSLAVMGAITGLALIVGGAGNITARARRNRANRTARHIARGCAVCAPRDEAGSIAPVVAVLLAIIAAGIVIVDARIGGTMAATILTTIDGATR